jgi:hypothetical protein
MYHLRARYMRPETGRFWTVDDYEGSFEEPQTLHKYAYAHENPIDNADPSGHFVSAGEATFTAGTVARLNATINLVGVIALHLIKTKIEEDQKGLFVYRQGEDKPKTVALRREIDWQTGLSFQYKKPPSPYIKFRVLTLLVAGYIVRPDVPGTAVTDVHDGRPIQPSRTYGPDHVTVYLPDMSRWDAWYEAEQKLKGVPGGASAETLALYALREILP